MVHSSESGSAVLTVTENNLVLNLKTSAKLATVHNLNLRRRH
jgi:hypothetical protein